MWLCVAVFGWCYYYCKLTDWVAVAVVAATTTTVRYIVIFCFVSSPSRSHMCTLLPIRHRQSHIERNRQTNNKDSTAYRKKNRAPYGSHVYSIHQIILKSLLLWFLFINTTGPLVPFLLHSVAYVTVVCISVLYIQFQFVSFILNFFFALPSWHSYNCITNCVHVVMCDSVNCRSACMVSCSFRIIDAPQLWWWMFSIPKIGEK